MRRRGECAGCGCDFSWSTCFPPCRGREQRKIIEAPCRTWNPRRLRRAGDGAGGLGHAAGMEREAIRLFQTKIAAPDATSRAAASCGVACGRRRHLRLPRQRPGRLAFCRKDGLERDDDDVLLAVAPAGRTRRNPQLGRLKAGDEPILPAFPVV